MQRITATTVGKTLQAPTSTAGRRVSDDAVEGSTSAADVPLTGAARIGIDLRALNDSGPGSARSRSPTERSCCASPTRWSGSWIRTLARSTWRATTFRHDVGRQPGTSAVARARSAAACWRASRAPSREKADNPPRYAIGDERLRHERSDMGDFGRCESEVRARACGRCRATPQAVGPRPDPLERSRDHRGDVVARSGIHTQNIGAGEPIPEPTRTLSRQRNGGARRPRHFAVLSVPPIGIEPTTFGTGNQRSIP